VVVAELVAVLGVLIPLALRDIAGDLHLCWRRDVFTGTSREAVIEEVAAKAIEVGGAETVVVRRFVGVFTRAAVVTRVGIAGAVSGILALRPSERWQTQTFGTLVAGDAGTAIATMKAAAGLRVIFTCGASKTLKANQQKHEDSDYILVNSSGLQENFN